MVDSASISLRFRSRACNAAHRCRAMDAPAQHANRDKQRVMTFLGWVIRSAKVPRVSSRSRDESRGRSQFGTPRCFRDYLIGGGGDRGTLSSTDRAESPSVPLHRVEIGDRTTEIGSGGATPRGRSWMFSARYGESRTHCPVLASLTCSAVMIWLSVGARVALPPGPGCGRLLHAG